MQAQILIKGAAQHNLKKIDVALPRNKLVVVTGVSGSGKSSLAFDTIYAEGQRRYVESLSSYARQFLEQMEKPDVEKIDGLSPAIAIEQRAASHNPRSTVGTVTEIHDFLRVLFARAGTPYCPRCNKPIAAQTVQQMADQILDRKTGIRFQVLAPVVRKRKGEFRKLLRDIARRGFVRVRINGEIVEITEAPDLDKKKAHSIEIVVDRLKVDRSTRGRLVDSLETALREASGLVVAAFAGGEEETYSENFACVKCGTSLGEMSPRAFSFNSPFGACEPCGGLGSSPQFDSASIVPDPGKSLEDGALRAPGWGNSSWLKVAIKSLQKAYKFKSGVPFRALPERVREIILHGSGEETFKFDWKLGKGRYTFSRAFEGVIPNLKRRYRASPSNRIRTEIEKLMTVRPCDECGGTRLKTAARFVRVGDRGIHEFSRMHVEAARAAFKSLKLSHAAAVVARPLLKEILERLGFLESVGLGYLTLDRAAATLSGGESQRIRLATQIGSRLSGVLYVLDEPSIGLHPRDNQRLLKTLRAMRDLGNTLIVVEHDEETIRAADQIVDLGPGAGEAGGELVAQGSAQDLIDCPRSLTGAYLSGRMKIQTPTRRRTAASGNVIVVKSATANNLKKIDVSFHLGLFTAVTGVSGSGKSSLVNEILYKALAQKLHGAHSPPGAHGSIRGEKNIDKVIDIDQSPIGRTPRSNPATYTGAFTFIRDLFARVPEARTRGYSAGRFSFNVKGGRCEACEGDGVRRIEMHFLPDVHVTCEECEGRRYNRETLEIRYKMKNIADVLEMSAKTAAEFFENIPGLRQKLSTVVSVGLGYIKLGQPATTLSGGEAQRIKLSRELGRSATGRTLYVLDEPTTGLHFDDVKKLLAILEELVEAGNTVIVIEHNMDVIRSADYIIDMGPEGGDAGGEVVASGTPEEVAKIRVSHTGACLRPLLGRKSGRKAGRNKSPAGA